MAGQEQQEDKVVNEVAKRDQAAPVAPISAALLEKIEQAVLALPTEDGNGSERIYEQLLAATSIDELNKPWAATSGKALEGKTLQIHKLTRRPSAFSDGPAIFLVVESTDIKTGEVVVWTTSSVAVIIQLAQAYNLGIMPITAEVVVAERPTERGFHPYHLNVIGANVPARS